MKIKSFMMLGRVHTSCLTQSELVFGYILAGGELFSMRTLLWMLFGFLFHYWGFLDNNLCDYEYDLRDPHKAHMPLVSGEVTIEHAKKIFYFTFGLMILYGLFLSGIKPLALSVLFISLGFGLLYNRTCKVNVLSPIWIALSFAHLLLFPYFSLRIELTLPTFLIFLYSIFLMFWQVSWEGYIKEFGVDKVNLLQRLGCQLNDGYFVPSLGAKTFGWALRVPTLIMGFFIWSFLGGGLYSLLGYAILSLGVIFSAYQLIKRRKYENRRTVLFCAITETLVYFSLVFALEGILGPIGVAFMILYPLIWFIAWNSYYWKTLISPMV